MEKLMQRVITECYGKHTAVADAAKKAFDAISEQQGGTCHEMYELREKCLTAIELALDSKQSRLVNLATNALQCMLRDNQLHSRCKEEHVERTMPMQIIHTLHDLPSWSYDSDLQCHCFTILLQLSSSAQWKIDANIVIAIVELCISTFAAANNQPSTEMAARATVIQTVNSFADGNGLSKNTVPVTVVGPPMDGVDHSKKASGELPVAQYFQQEIAKLLKYFCTKLKSITSSPQESAPLLLMLDAVLAILNSQQESICDCADFIESLWQELAPLLINILGDPKHINISSGGSMTSSDGNNNNNSKGRGCSSAVGKQVIFRAPEVAKSSYRICSELLRLLGSNSSMRSVLEALFHRFLLFPPPENRLEALKALKSILESPARIIDLGFHFKSENATKTVNGGEKPNLRLWKIVIDCLTECATVSNEELCTTAARCATELITSLETLCDENAVSILSERNIVELNGLYRRLSDTDADFEAKKDVSKSLSNKKVAENTKENDLKGDIIEGAGDSEIVLDQSLITLASRLDTKLNEDGVVEYLDRIHCAWRENLNHPSSMISCGLQKCSSFDQRELISASDYVQELLDYFPTLNALKSTIELDTSLQHFAVQTFEKFMMKQLNLLQERGSLYEIAIYNADALYLLSYASLNLILYNYELKSTMTNVISNSRYSDIITEDQFVSGVIDVGVIVYISISFVKAVYYLIMEKNDILTLASNLGPPSTTLCNLVKDYSGRSGEILSDFIKLEQSVKRKVFSDHYLAATKIARCLISSSWNNLTEILSILIDDHNSHRNRLVPNLHTKSTNQNSARQFTSGIAACVNGLQKLLTLCPKIDLSHKMGCIFRKLVEASCPLEDLRSFAQKEYTTGQQTSQLTKLAQKLPINLHNRFDLYPAHVLSMQLLIDNAITVGSIDHSCWNPIIRCVEFVSELERVFFTSNKKLSACGKTSSDSSRNPLNLHNSQDDVIGGDGIDFAFILPSSPVRLTENVFDVLKEAGGDDVTKCTALPDKISARILCILSAKVERFYDDCTRLLNMSALKEFVKSLITYSQSNLFYGSSSTTMTSSSSSCSNAIGHHRRSNPCVFLEQSANILMRLVKSGRPLIHVMTVWGVLGPHFVEAACVSNPEVSRRSIDLLRQCLSTILENTSGFDLRNFHLNESLFQPFQTILCLELCNEDSVDAILSSIAELVESYKHEVHTGWKSLFGALRATRNSFVFSKECSSKTDLKCLHNAFVDVFSNFLKPDNVKVFSRAAGECITCLLRFLSDGNHYDESNFADIKEISPSTNHDNDKFLTCESSSAEPNFPKTALCFLRQCHVLLVSLYEICSSDDIVVHLMHRLTQKDHSRDIVDTEKLSSSPSSIDRFYEKLPSLATFLSENQTNLFGCDFPLFYLEMRIEDQPLPLPWADLVIGKRLICEAWVDLIEGLVGGVITCHSNMQPEVIECVFDITDTLLSIPGLTFGAHCLNHLLLPMLQRWLRRESSQDDAEWRENKFSVRNFKQCIGLTVDTVVKYVEADPNAQCNRLLLNQTYDVLIECASNSSEFIARLGLASLRHVILSLSSRLSRDLWSDTCRCLWRFGATTLQPLRLLMSYFAAGSHRYDGDLGSVQVAVRKDSNPTEAARIRALAQQVFLADSQKYEENLEDHPDKLSQSYRSIVFLLNPCDMNADTCDVIIRLPFRKIVVALLAHQLWLQLIGSLLCDGTALKLSTLSTTLARHVSSDQSKSSKNGQKRLPGCLNFLTNSQIVALLSCLNASFSVAYEFERRSGLKFLIQKVFSSPVSANLYKQLVTCWTFKLISLYELTFNYVTTTSSADPKTFKALADDDSIVAEINVDEDKSSDTVTLNGKLYFHVLCRSFARVCDNLCDLDVTMGKDSVADRLSIRTLEFLPLDGAAATVAKRRKSSVRRQMDARMVSSSDEESDYDNDSSRASSPPYPVSAPPSNPSLAPNSSNSAPKIDKSNENSETVCKLATAEVIDECLKDYKRQKMKSTLPATDKNVLTKKDASQATGTTVSSTTNQAETAATTISRPNPFDQSPSNDSKAEMVEKIMQSDKPLGPDQDPSLKREAISSLTKDSEAACLAWSEMATSLPRLVLTQSDPEFRLMLSVVYQPLGQMAARSNSAHVKLLIADMFYRLSEVYKFFG